MPQAPALHRNTPTLTALDPRGLAVRSVGYCRSEHDVAAETRVGHQSWNLAGHPWRSTDARLGNTPDKANLARLTSLSGRLILSESVDAGWQLHLHAESGATHRSWDGRNTSTRFVHDSQVRLVAIGQTLAQGAEAVIERFDYASTDPAFATYNQCGRLLRHDDPAGSEHVCGYALTGGVTAQRRHFLLTTDLPDWPENTGDRDLLLESAGFTSRSTYGPAGDVSECTDAVGNRHLFSRDLCGQLRATRLSTVTTGITRPLVRDIRYNAMGQIESETAGNGVVSEALHDPATNRLLNLRSSHPAGPVLQDLHYRHDPAGNLVAIEDRVMPVRYFKNQRIEPVDHYRYDSLYQLVEASGREQDNATHGPSLPELQPAPIDPTRLSNYRQTYTYDAAGNLTGLRHVGARQYTRTFNIASDSNRALANDAFTGQFDSGFDANGNLARLAPGQTLQWNGRNQLSQVTTVTRSDAADDHERYVHDGNGKRVRKVRQRLVSGRVVSAEIRYLPGLELHRDGTGGDYLHVVLGEAGHTHVHVLHWSNNLPPDLDNDQYRYQLRDHLGSSCLELDESAAVLTHEGYYPFGATASWAARTPGQAAGKRRRYSGKERDASGLYYYGLRYYAPWLMRWINPDPAGYQDGLNLYRMVGNSPLSYRDEQGTQGIPADILVMDTLAGADIGNGWFEELRWDTASTSFQTTRSVYSRDLTPLNAEPEWSLSDGDSAVAIFNDPQGNPRLFASTYMRHMGIQPGMGLPLFAGRIRQGNDGAIVFDNHSGHYKPLANETAVNGLLSRLAPGAENIRYEPIAASAAFDSALRLPVGSPEEYVDLVGRLKGGHEKVTAYLKDNGLWDSMEEVYKTSDGVNILFEADRKGISPNEVHKRRELAALSAAPASKTRQRPPQPPLPQRQSAVATRTGGWRSMLRQCIGRR